MRWSLTFALMIGALAIASQDARAAGWCAWYDWNTYNCGFKTFQQCLATISGIGGECRPDVRGDERRVRERQRYQDDRRLRKREP